MNPERESRSSVRATSSGISITRFPIGSLSPLPSGTSIKPRTRVFGTVAASITLIQGRGFRDEKYAAASFTSAAETLFAVAIISVSGRVGTELFLEPSRKLATCCTIYSAGRPARLEFSGRPSPFGRWQNPQAYVLGDLPCATGSDIGGWSSGYQSGTLNRSRNCVLVKRVTLFGTCCNVPSSGAGCRPGGLTA